MDNAHETSRELEWEGYGDFTLSGDTGSEIVQHRAHLAGLPCAEEELVTRAMTCMHSRAGTGPDTVTTKLLLESRETRSLSGSRRTRRSTWRSSWRECPIPQNGRRGEGRLSSGGCCLQWPFCGHGNVTTTGCCDRRGGNQEVKVLVTGGTGYVGYHLVGALLRAGNTVRVLDLQPPSGEHLTGLGCGFARAVSLTQPGCSGGAKC